MQNVKSITMTILAGNCLNDAYAEAFATFAGSALNRRYPAADITVDLVANTSGCGPRPMVFVENDDFHTEKMVINECDRLWEDWERAGWPGMESDD